MSVAIIDYGSGNLCSAEKAFSRMAGERRVDLTSDPDIVAKADHIVVPGVGAFADCYRGLMALSGMHEAICQRVFAEGRPLLGVCVGMQMFCDRGYENGEHAGLGWLAGNVQPLQPLGPASDPASDLEPSLEADEGLIQNRSTPCGPNSLKIPHMGWNNIRITQEHPILDGLAGADMYFVHSYAAHPSDRAHVYAECTYGEAVTAVMGAGPIIGTQFHPEKSQSAGLRLIENFLRWRP